MSLMRTVRIMATENVRIRLDTSKLNPYLHNVADLSVQRAAGRVTARAQANAPKRTGQLRASIKPRKAPDKQQGLEVTYLVGSRGVPYARYQEHGTGPITPRNAKALRFVPKGGFGYVFAMYTKGVPATHFLKKAYDTISIRDYQ